MSGAKFLGRLRARPANGARAAGAEQSSKPAWADVLRQQGSTGMIGVLGGMGPVASAEFVKTIYDGAVEDREQYAPAVILYSDPGFPDRTEAFLSGQEDRVLERLTGALSQLERAGASAIVICCMTIHYLLPRLPAALRTRIVSLLDVVLAELEEIDQPLLLVCSSGTRAVRLFEAHPAWRRMRRLVLLPNARDQEHIHRDVIYSVKRGVALDVLTARLVRLVEAYDASGFVVGCTEVHVLAKHHLAGAPESKRFVCVDPLLAIAQQIRRQSESRRTALPHYQQAHV